MKFLVDECLPHETVGRLVTRGSPDAGHQFHIGLRGRRDDQIVAHALAEDRTILTSNAADYRRLLSRQPVHAGGILLPNVDKEASWRLITVALAFLELQPRPVDWMVDRVVEVSADEGICPYELPSGGEPSGTLRHVSGCDLQPVPRPLQLAVIVPT